MVGAGDHTAPGRQPLSSNPLSDVMTLSNLDHLLKHVPRAVNAAALVSRAPLPACSPCPITSRLLGGSLLPGGRDKDAARRRRETHARTHRNSPRRERENPPSHRNLRGRSKRKAERESEGSGEGRNGRGEKERE